jgi:hypothetical protein
MLRVDGARQLIGIFPEESSLEKLEQTCGRFQVSLISGRAAQTIPSVIPNVILLLAISETFYILFKAILRFSGIFLWTTKYRFSARERN